MAHFVVKMDFVRRRNRKVLDAKKHGTRSPGAVHKTVEPYGYVRRTFQHVRGAES